MLYYILYNIIYALCTIHAICWECNTYFTIHIFFNRSINSHSSFVQYIYIFNLIMKPYVRKHSFENHPSDKWSYKSLVSFCSIPFNVSFNLSATPDKISRYRAHHISSTMNEKPRYHGVIFAASSRPSYSRLLKISSLIERLNFSSMWQT